MLSYIKFSLLNFNIWKGIRNTLQMILITFISLLCGFLHYDNGLSPCLDLLPVVLPARWKIQSPWLILDLSWRWLTRISCCFVTKELWIIPCCTDNNHEIVNRSVYCKKVLLRRF